MPVRRLLFRLGGRGVRAGGFFGRMALRGYLSVLRGWYAPVSARLPGFKSLPLALEKKFEGLTARLDCQTGCADGLAKDAEGLLKLVAGHGGEGMRITRAIEVIRGPLSFLEMLLSQGDHLVGLLAPQQGRIKNLRGLQDRLASELAPMRQIQSLFRMESARLPVEVQTVFNSLSQEIRTLHERVEVAFAEQSATLLGFEEQLSMVLVEFERGTLQRRRAIEDKQRLIAKTLDDLTSDLERNRVIDVRLSESSQRVFEQVNKVVWGLQFHDITRQKIEHAVDGLQELLEVVSGAGAYPASVKAGDAVSVLAYVSAMTRLQLRQVGTVREDLVKAEKEISAGIAAIGETVREMDEKCLSLSEFKSLSVGCDGMVQVLLGVLDDVMRLLGEILKTLDTVYTAIVPLRGVALNLTGRLRDLALNIQLIGLNAQIQAAQLENGSVLEVLARRTADISSSVVQINEEAGVLLAGLSQDMDQLVADFGQLKDLGGSEAVVLEEKARGVGGELHEFRDRTLKLFTSVCDLAARLEKDVAETEVVTFSHLVEERLEPLRAHLVAIDGQLTAIVPGVALGADVAKAALAHLDGCYTMATEREVHDSVTAGRAEVAGAPAEAGGTVEMFGVGDSGPAAVPVPRAEVGSVLAGSGSGAAPEGGAGKPDPVFGDNVELF